MLVIAGGVILGGVVLIILWGLLSHWAEESQHWDMHRRRMAALDAADKRRREEAEKRKAQQP